MSNEALTAGDTVQLKSGGPVMTIEWIEDNEVHCVWFEKNDARERTFNPAVLKKFDNTGYGLA